MTDAKEEAYLCEIEELQAQRDKQFLEINRLKSIISVLQRNAGYRGTEIIDGMTDAESAAISKASLGTNDAPSSSDSDEGR